MKMKMEAIGKQQSRGSLLEAHPVGIQGGAYFTKLTNDNKPLFIQMTSCKTKQGIVKTGKKKYIDLMFSSEDVDIIQWVENLEKKIQEMIFEKRNMWFNNELELEDIEGAFTSPIRVYKSGKYYLVRVYIQTQIPGTNGFTCYDEDEKIVNPDDINEDNERDASFTTAALKCWKYLSTNGRMFPTSGMLPNLRI